MYQLKDWDGFTGFLLDIDALKLEERQSYIVGGRRRENTAEHSWHVAMAAWTLAKHATVPVSLERVFKLALVHDLCELDHGDTFIHTADRDAKHEREAQCVARLMRDHGAVFDELEALWQEYEAGSTVEARFVNAADRLLPFLHNLASEGGTWREHGIARSQVRRLYDGLQADFPQLVEWVERKLDEAVARGWLRDA